MTLSLQLANKIEEITKQNDEIKPYYNSRHISACKPCWQIFRYNIHYMQSLVERLKFHIPNKQFMAINDKDLIEETMSKDSIQ